MNFRAGFKQVLNGRWIWFLIDRYDRPLAISLREFDTLLEAQVDAESNLPLRVAA